MLSPSELAALPPMAQKVLSKDGPPPLRQLAAKGIAPGFKPADALTVLVALADGEEEGAVRDTARATLQALPAPLLNGALSGALPPFVLARVAPFFTHDVSVMEKILTHASITPEIVATLAETSSEAVSELIATNEERLLGHPPIVEKLYLNKNTRMSTADRVLELAVRNKIELALPAFREAATAIVNELIVEPQEEPTPDDLLFRQVEQLSEALGDAVEDTHERDEDTGEERVKQKFEEVEKKLHELTPSQKIRRAILGKASDRLILARDPNKTVAQAAARSPLLQENDVVQITASRAICEEVLRIFAMDATWTRSHSIKYNLVQNPRTPFAFVLRFMQHLRDNELKQLAKSKNVTGNVSEAAKQLVLKRSQKK